MIVYILRGGVLFKERQVKKMRIKKSQRHQMRAGPSGSSVAMRCMSGDPTAMCVGMSMTQSLRPMGSVAMVSAGLD